MHMGTVHRCTEDAVEQVSGPAFGAVRRKRRPICRHSPRSVWRQQGRVPEGGRPAASAIAARSRWGNAPPNRYHSCVTSDDTVSHFSFMNESHHDASRQASPLHSEPLADRSPRCILLILLNPRPSLRLVRRGCDGGSEPLSYQRDKEAHREYRATSQEEGSRRSEEAGFGSSRL